MIAAPACRGWTRMKKIIIAVLLSLLIGPGVGQLYNREFKKGWLLIGFTAVIFILFFGTLTKAAMQMLPPGSAMMTPEIAQEIVQKIFEKNPRPFYLFKFILIIAYAYSIVDAYKGASPKKRISHAPGNIGTDTPH